jgi:hypothetical protein
MTSPPLSSVMETVEVIMADLTRVSDWASVEKISSQIEEVGVFALRHRTQLRVGPD